MSSKKLKILFTKPKVYTLNNALIYYKFYEYIRDKHNYKIRKNIYFFESGLLDDVYTDTAYADSVQYSNFEQVPKEESLNNLIEVIKRFELRFIQLLCFF